ncbi:MAG: divergent polysaccharide deacetylase family protein [Maritimibacter sp.]|uniref:divergent polysaccharide deacetylase family protein n=1 Tax=Maritimibacter sp. TaxID=2003363 RepID=UPI001D8DADEC|nr:divergent polysaccharide deacetylase family protein [Maritimibacter sp.]MBL6426140.1 divergent polysaccharide deacetylase family protein [Maritimibacter sp.]
MANGMVSGVFAGVVVAAVGVATAALVIEPVEMGEPGPVAEAPVASETPEPVEPDESAPDGQEPEAETADATETESATPAVTASSETQAPEADPIMVEPTPRPSEEEMERDEAAAEAEPAMDPEPMVEAEPETVSEAAPDPAVPDAPDEDLAEAPEADAPEATDTEVAQLPMVVAPSNPTEPDVAMPETGNDTVRAEGASVFDPPPLEDDTLEEPAPSGPVVTGRLPTIGESAADEAAVDAGPQPAIRRNAVPYDGIAELPEMAVLLMDMGPGRADVGDLAVMPFPMSVAVDASSPDAAEAIAFYRANGAEVVLIVPLPELATAMDVDVTFQAYDPLMTDIVAVMFPPEAGFQGLGDAAAQVVTNLDERGLGLVTYPEGLNTGHKVAVSEDVPAGQIFRDLDGDGQAGDVMRRFLDNVAFRARNDEGVIAVARVRPESIQALLEWSLGNRAQSVNFAPVSAVLLDE